VEQLRILSSYCTLGYNVNLANFANAGQNYLKAKGKWEAGEKGLATGYGAAFTLYLAGGASFSAASIEIGVAAAGYAKIGATKIKSKVLLKASLRGATELAQRQALAATGRLVATRVLGLLSFTGWGLVFTVLAVGIEGLVIYMDRTPLEEWIEGSYFGIAPRYRGGPGRRDNKPDNWAPEEAALIAAVKKANEDLMTDGDYNQEPDYTQPGFGHGYQPGA
jgi:hypothetical protein